MHNIFRFTQKNALNSLDFIKMHLFNEDFSSSHTIYSNKEENETVIGVFSCKLDKIDESWINDINNSLDLIILIDELSSLNLKAKKSLKTVFQEIFNSPFFPNKEEFIKFIKAGKIAVASFGKSNSLFKIDEAIRNALREASKNINIALAKAALVHIQFNHSLSKLDFYRAIEILHEALNDQAHVCCSFKLQKSSSNFLKAFLILTGFNSIKELKNENYLSQLFNLEPESKINEEKLNLNLDLPIID